MKETGVIRRIDELGRIVIPKEIRKRLRVGPGDLLDIYTQDKQIIFSKYSQISELEENLEHLLKAFSNNHLDIVVTSSSEVISSTYKDIHKNDLIDTKFLHLFLKNGILELSPSNSVQFTNDVILTDYVYARKLLNDGDLCSLIILISKEPLMKSDLEVLEVIEKYLVSYIQYK